MFGMWKRKPLTAAPADGMVVAALRSDPGCVRELNEDFGSVIRPADAGQLGRKGTLVLVADGMGGHQAGEVASRTAVELIARRYYDGRQGPGASLERAFREANRDLYQLARKQERLRGMGTTCAALALQGSLAHSAYVGDTRLYLVRDGELYRMSEDHSAVAELVRQGVITAEQARRHELRHVILRALGGHREVEVAGWENFPVEPADRYVVCSDGLYDMVEENEIREIVEANDPPAAAEALVALARERGGHDNITVAVAGLDAMPCQAVAVPGPTREVKS